MVYGHQIEKNKQRLELPLSYWKEDDTRNIKLAALQISEVFENIGLSFHFRIRKSVTECFKLKAVQEEDLEVDLKENIDMGEDIITQVLMLSI